MIIAAFGVFYLYKTVTKNDNNQVESNDANSETKNDNIKDDINKDYVFDADYSTNTIKDSYRLSNDVTKVISSKDIKVPYINIKSEEISKINDKLYNLQQELIKKFNEYASTGNFYYTVSYKWYVNNNILSLVIVTEQGGTDIPFSEYYIYNINLSTGKTLTFKQIVSKKELNISNISNNLQSKLKALVNDYSGNDNSCTDTFRGDKNQTPLEASIDEYNDNLANDDIYGYVDATGDLHVVTKIYFCAGSGNSYKDIVIK